MSGKGDARRPSATAGAYSSCFARIFTPAEECPGCGELEHRPTGQDDMWECPDCGLQENRAC